MRDIDLDEEKTAARLAREAAEQARRIEIMNKISKLEKEKDKCEECVSGLSAVKGQLVGLESSWSMTYSSEMQSDTVREVSVPGAFEGNTANIIKVGMSDAMEKMKNCVMGIYQVMGNVEIQIGKLHQYIDKFRKINDKVYTFQIYHISGYNYLLCVRYVEGNKVITVHQEYLIPTFKFEFTEGKEWIAF